ncbi:porin, partial [Escherichia coli]|uniref:porin n=1 Tax=Escherichia coli TaxID=562 RepID=UPI001F2614D0
YDGFYNKSSGKLRVDGHINNRLSIFGLAAVKSIKDSYGLNEDNTTFTRYSTWSPYGDWDGKWEAMIGGAYVVNPKVTFNAQAGYTA